MVASPGNWTGHIPAPRFYPRKKVYRERLLSADEVPLGYESVPNISLLWGTRGTGKSLNMCAIAALTKRHAQAQNRYVRVLTNFHFAYADYSSPYLVDELLTYDPWYDGSLVCLDELTAFFHNRRSLARSAVDFSIFLTQIRKRNIDMIFTTQFPTQVDIQVLQQIDFFIQPRRRFLPGVSGFHTDLYIHNFWGHITGKYYRENGQRKLWPPPPEEADWSKRFYNLQTLFGTYDTTELQGALWGGAREDIINRQWSQEQLMDLRHLHEQEQASGDDEISPGPIPMPQAPPANLEEFLERLKPSGRFPVASILEQVKLLDGSIDQTPKLREYLQKHGWSIARRGAYYDAEWLQG